MNNVDFQRERALAPGAFPKAVGMIEVSENSIPVLKQYLQIARRRKWLILASIVSVLLLGLLATLLMTPLYTAKAVIEIQRVGSNIVNVEAVEPAENSLDQEFYQTQYGLLRARSLAERVSRQLRLDQDPAFQRAFGIDEAVAAPGARGATLTAAQRELRLRQASNILLKNFEIDPVRLSRLVEVSFTSADPELSARIVNAWTSNFIQQTLERRFEATSYARNFLENRLEQVRRRLETSERLLVAYAGRQGIITLAPQAGGSGGSAAERPLVADDLAALNAELAEATADRVKAQSRIGASGGQATEVLQNPAIPGLRQRRAEIAADYAKLLTQFDPEYPPALALAAQLRQIDQAIAGEESRVRGSLRENVAAAAQREGDLEQRVDELKTGLLDFRKRSIQYNIYQRDADTNRQLYQALLQRYKEIGVAGGVGVNNISVVDGADVPQVPSSPRLALNLVIALAAGLGLGIALALALEQIDEAIADPGELEGTLGLPLLGAIPKASDGNVMEELQDRKSGIFEAYLSVQANLEFATDHGVPRSLAVTSTRPGEGKSTTSYAIAQSLARTRRKVLLIDGDMRSPSLHHLLGVQNDLGLSNYLAGDDDFQRLIRSDPDDGLATMTAGPQPPNAAELISGGRLKQLLQELAKIYDHVVIDSPPVMGLADAPLLASQVEGTIYVVESHGTRSSMARLALSRLGASQAHIIGAILTKFEAKRAFYGYGYDYGYGYGQSRPSASNG